MIARTQPSFWPSSHLLVTADTPSKGDEHLSPKHQIRFLNSVSALAGADIFADSLVYSTPDGNTGWTAMRMGPRGHVTYHHWDSAVPHLLQLDLFGIGAIDDLRLLAALDEFWTPGGMRVIALGRSAPPGEVSVTSLRDDAVTRTRSQPGLGPGDHLHLMVDQIGPSGRRALNPPRLDSALQDLVEALKMRAMTPVIRHDRVDQEELTYEAIVGITTSHICIRLRQMRGRVELSLDVFSCRKFSADAVIRWLDAVVHQPEHRRCLLYNRYPMGKIVQVS